MLSRRLHRLHHELASLPPQSPHPVREELDQTQVLSNLPLFEDKTREVGEPQSQFPLRRQRRLGPTTKGDQSHHVLVDYNTRHRLALSCHHLGTCVRESLTGIELEDIGAVGEERRLAIYLTTYAQECVLRVANVQTRIPGGKVCETEVGLISYCAEDGVATEGELEDLVADLGWEAQEGGVTVTSHTGSRSYSNIL